MDNGIIGILNLNRCADGKHVKLIGRILPEKLKTESVQVDMCSN